MALSCSGSLQHGKSSTTKPTRCRPGWALVRATAVWTADGSPARRPSALEGSTLSSPGALVPPLQTGFGPSGLRKPCLVEVLGRELSAEESSLWQESCRVLEDTLGFSADDCERLLARAFGWSTQAFWRREKVEEVPTPQQVAGSLAFLRDDVGLSGEEQAKVVRACPELLACDVDSRLRANVSQLQSQWRLQGPTLTKAVLRQPQVLGYSVDCGGDCIGECNRCWARF